VRNPRPVGAPQMTMGRTIRKALISKGIATDFPTWRKLAQDRATWRARTHPDPSVAEAAKNRPVHVRQAKPVPRAARPPRARAPPPPPRDPNAPIPHCYACGAPKWPYPCWC
jgi:hypothetical protein